MVFPNSTKIQKYNLFIEEREMFSYKNTLNSFSHFFMSSLSQWAVWAQISRHPSRWKLCVVTIGGRVAMLLKVSKQTQNHQRLEKRPPWTIMLDEYARNKGHSRPAARAYNRVNPESTRNPSPGRPTSFTRHSSSSTQ